MDISRSNLSGIAILVIVSVVIISPLYTTAQPGYSDWSAPVSLGPTVNSTGDDIGPSLSRDGLSLYFASNRPGTLGLNDIWVSQRNSLEEPWGPPTNLGPVVNSIDDDPLPNLSRDGHWLFFPSKRPGGFGNFDIWVSYREHIHDNFDWQLPVNAGPIVNLPTSEQNPSFFDNEDVGVPQLFFTRADASGIHIVVSNRLPDGTFGPASPVAELNSTANDRGISVRFDGLEVFLMSTRSGGVGLQDLWTATRNSVLDTWSKPTNLGTTVNSIAGDQNPYIASDRETLFFNSDRTGGLGGQDLYVSTRTRKKP